MTVQTKTELCNLTLDMLTQTKIVDIEDNTSIAQSLKINYDQVRDEVLESYFWDFAKKKAAIAALSTPPAFGWSYAYEIPADCLTIVSINENGSFNAPPISYEIVGNEIHTNQTAPLKLTYISRVEITSRYSALFTRAFAARLAAVEAKRITGSEKTAELMQQYYIQALEAAEQHDSMQGTAEDPYPNDTSVIASRSV